MADMVDAEELDPRRRARTPSKGSERTSREGSRARGGDGVHVVRRRGRGERREGATAAAVAAFVAAPAKRPRRTPRRPRRPGPPENRRSRARRARSKANAKFSEVRAKAAPTKVRSTPGTFTLRRMRFDGAGRARRRTRRRPSPTASAARSSAPRALQEAKPKLPREAAPSPRDVASAAAAGAAETASSSALRRRTRRRARGCLCFAGSISRRFARARRSRRSANPRDVHQA